MPSFGTKGRKSPGIGDRQWRVEKTRMKSTGRGFSAVRVLVLSGSSLAAAPPGRVHFDLDGESVDGDEAM